MSFGPPYPYGTPGGDEIILTAQNPPQVRVARGNTVIVFLTVNGRLAERLRENVEDVVRILGLNGALLVAIITRENDVVRDPNTSDMNFKNAFTLTQIAPGVINVEIAADGITADMIKDGIISALHFAPGAVDTAALGAGAVTGPKLAAGAVGAAALDAGAVGTAALGAGAVTGPKVATDAIDASHIQAGAVGSSELAAGAAVAGKIGPGAVGSTELAAGAAVAGKIGAGAVGATEILDGSISAVEMDTNTKPEWVFLLNDTFTSVGSYIAPAGTFNVTYDDYRIELSNLSMSANAELLMTLRNSGGVLNSANYYGNLIFAGSAGPTISSTALSGGSNGRLMIAGGVIWREIFSEIDIISPALTARTSFLSKTVCQYATGGAIHLAGNVFQLTTAADAFVLSASTGTITGKIRVYGKRIAP